MDLRRGTRTYSVCFEEHMPRPKVPQEAVTGFLGFMMGSKETLDRVKKNNSKDLEETKHGNQPKDQN